jgi:hypothetical protein
LAQALRRQALENIVQALARIVVMNAALRIAIAGSTRSTRRLSASFASARRISVHRASAELDDREEDHPEEMTRRPSWAPNAHLSTRSLVKAHHTEKRNEPTTTSKAQRTSISPAQCRAIPEFNFPRFNAVARPSSQWHKFSTPPKKILSAMGVRHISKGNASGSSLSPRPNTASPSAQHWPTT